MPDDSVPVYRWTEKELPLLNRSHSIRFVLTLVILLLVALSSMAQEEQLTVTRVAGTEGGGGYFDGIGNQARFYQPLSLDVDHEGNIYVADTGNDTIRKISPDGRVTTLAGLAGEYGRQNGTGDRATFRHPGWVAVDDDGIVYVSDGPWIRRITQSGRVTTFAGAPNTYGSADGPLSEARFQRVTGVDIDQWGTVFVADQGNHTIRKITVDGMVTTLAGAAGQPGSSDGAGGEARFNSPQDVAAGLDGNVYVADVSNQTIRKVAPDGTVTTLSGMARTPGSTDGPGGEARFASPSSIAVAPDGSLVVADTSSSLIRRIMPDGTTTTIAGSGQGSDDGPALEARFRFPYGVTVGSDGTVYVADSGNSTIRQISTMSEVTTLAGRTPQSGRSDGTGSEATFSAPSDVATDSAGNIFIADSNNVSIRKITPAGVVSTFAGSGGYGSIDGAGAAAAFTFMQGIASDALDNLYVADTGGHTIRKVSPGGVVTTIAGAAAESGDADGTGSAARFLYPNDVAVDDTGTLYVADSGNHTIRRITPSGVVTTMAGLAGSAGHADGISSTARFDYPRGVSTGDGNVYVADSGNATIRSISPSGEVTTLAGLAGSFDVRDGTGAEARFGYPLQMAVDHMGNIWVASAQGLIRRVTPEGVVTSPIGVRDYYGSVEGVGNGARLTSTGGLAVDGSGRIYVADPSNHAVFVMKEGLPDAAAIDTPLSPIGQTRALSVSPDTASSWTWSVIRRPAGSEAELSATDAATPSFTPDGLGLYVFRLDAERDGIHGITTVDLVVTPNRRRAVTVKR